jgi:hypothetical protein
VVEHGKAPWVLEGDEVRFARVVVEVYGLEVAYLLARHLRAVDPLLELWWEQSRPYQKEAPVSSLLELGHYAVDNVRLGGDDVYGVHVPLRGPPLLEALDVWQR